jgi:signal transduction histidine kinase
LDSRWNTYGANEIIKEILSTVKGIIDLQGGSIAVLSEGLGKGTKFTIRLPLLE